MAKYTVFVDDNFRYMDEDARSKLGEFDDCASAVAACKRIVDSFLATCDASRGADEMYNQYTAFGEDPWIRTEGGDCGFSAWTYARERTVELARGYLPHLGGTTPLP
jgi:hypothetical protein